jgi:hypothetical protein
VSRNDFDVVLVEGNELEFLHGDIPAGNSLLLRKLGTRLVDRKP